MGRYRQEKTSDLGLNITTIAGTLRNYFYGAEATEFKDAGDSFDVFTRLTQKDKDRLRTLPNVLLFTPDGRMIKLKNVAKIVQGEGPIEIERKNRQKIIKVEADFYQSSLGKGERSNPKFDDAVWPGYNCAVMMGVDEALEQAMFEALTSLHKKMGGKALKVFSWPLEKIIY